MSNFTKKNFYDIFQKFIKIIFTTLHMFKCMYISKKDIMLPTN